MRRVLCLPLLLVLSSCVGPEQSESGLPASALADRVERMDRWLQRYIDDEEVAGAVALVLQDGRPVYERAVGWSDREAGRRMSTDTIFRIASHTKALTSVAVLSLVEEGTIGLTDSVSRFIPEFAATHVMERSGAGVEAVPSRRPITIGDLLTHTAGISYGTEPEIADLYEAQGLGPAAGFGWYTADKNEPICTTMERLASLPFVAQPGEDWVYGYSIDVLGCVAERASGMSLDALIAARITEPLRMNDTVFFLPAEQQNRLAAVYAGDADGRAVRATDGPRGQGAYVEGPRRSFAGGAGLLSTASDYGRFLEMIRSGGTLDGVRILTPRTVQLMTTNQVGTLHSSDGLGFGMGFQTTDVRGANGLDSAGAFGWGGAYGTVYRVDPEARLVMVLMLQLLPNATTIRTEFPTLVYQAFADTAGRVGVDTAP